MVSLMSRNFRISDLFVVSEFEQKWLAAPEEPGLFVLLLKLRKIGHNMAKYLSVHKFMSPRSVNAWISHHVGNTKSGIQHHSMFASPYWFLPSFHEQFEYCSLYILLHYPRCIALSSLIWLFQCNVTSLSVVGSVESILIIRLKSEFKKLTSVHYVSES